MVYARVQRTGRFLCLCNLSNKASDPEDSTAVRRACLNRMSCSSMFHYRQLPEGNRASRRMLTYLVRDYHNGGTRSPSAVSAHGRALTKGGGQHLALAKIGVVPVSRDSVGGAQCLREHALAESAKVIDRRSEALRWLVGTPR